MDEQTAIIQIRQGNLKGLEYLVERYQARAVHAAYLVVYDRALAEDVVQSAFVKVIERIHQFDESRDFAPWFYRIVVNDALKATRHDYRNAALDETIAAPEMLPEQLLEQLERGEDVLAAVHKLSPEQRVVVTMRYFLGLKEVDMSHELGRPVSTIKWWLREARNNLRTLLDGYRR